MVKNEGFPDNLTEITIQPMSEKVEIHIDDSVDIKKQIVKIETESEKKCFCFYGYNKSY